MNKKEEKEGEIERIANKAKRIERPMTLLKLAVFVSNEYPF
ncbi:hypothetical protein M2101_002469 [Parabacteroides sp. PM5-20]|nr:MULTISPECIES: hypothetical protein [unclassified Parabacteroides]MDH6535773.1 hypothetical protein [Parabacteroides sp. PM5-20]